MVFAVNITKKKKRPSMHSTTRALFHEAKGLCSYCRRETEPPSMLPGRHHGLTATVDHVIPTSRGGKLRGENAVLACATCNNIKSDMMPEVWRAFMASNPRWWEKRGIGFGSRVKLTADLTSKWLRDQAMIAETKRAFAAWQAADKSSK